MEYRQLGNSGLSVSVLGLGCSRLGRSVFEDNRAAAHALLAAAIDCGVNLVDTAPNYAYGDSERLLGRFLAGRRDQVLLATKGGYRYSSSARYARWALPVLAPARQLLRRRRSALKQASAKRQDFTVAYLRRCLHASLRRLGTDYLDIYLLHSPPIDVIEREETLRFLEDIGRDGKVRVCGASVNSPQDALRCLAHPVYRVLQVGFSVADQRPLREVLPGAAASGVGIIVKTPLARGLLTSDYRITTGRYQEDDDPARTARRRKRLAFLGRPIEQAALRFVLGFAPVASVLTGTVDVKHLAENAAAVATGRLHDDILGQAAQLCQRDLEVPPEAL